MLYNLFYFCGLNIILVYSISFQNIHFDYYTPVHFSIYILNMCILVSLPLKSDQFFFLFTKF